MKARNSDAVQSLALRLLALWLLSSLVVVVWAMAQLRHSELREGGIRAQMSADAIASRVTRAVALGIPLNRLQGVDTLFSERLRTLTDVAALSLQDAGGRVLWTSHQGGDAPKAPEGTAIVSDIIHEGSKVASVVLVMRETGIGALLMRWFLPLAALVCALAALARLTLERNAIGGRAAREALAQAASERIREGDFSLRLPPLPLREFDQRLPWLAGQLRSLNERYLRVRRLVNSLRKTEPDPDRFAVLDQLLQDTTAQDRYRGMTSEALLEVPGAKDFRRYGEGACAAIAAWLVTGAVQILRPETGGATLLAMLLTAAALAGMGAFALGPADGSRPFAYGFAMGFFAPGPGLAWSLLLVAKPETYLHLGGIGNALMVCSIFVSTAVALGVVGRSRSRNKMTIAQEASHAT